MFTLFCFSQLKCLLILNCVNIYVDLFNKNKLMCLLFVTFVKVNIDIL